MTITSLTATTAAPLAAPKGAVSAVQTPSPDVQATAISADMPLLSNAELAVAAAKQSAATQQDGLSVLMANLLRATAAGNLPSPVQSAVDQLIALHLPTDQAPDAASVKSALLTSGLFTEAVLAGNRTPADVKTALLQLNTALEAWLARTTLAADPPRTTASPPAAPSTPKTAPAAPIATPRVAEREPARRAGTRPNDVSKPATPMTTPRPQGAPAGKNQTPIEASTPSAPFEAAPDAESVKSAIRVLGQIAQAKASPDLPKEIKAVLTLLTSAITATTAEEPQALSLAATPSGQRVPPSTPAVIEPSSAPAPTPQVRSASPQLDVGSETPAVAPPALVPQRVQLPSPVEQLLALQLGATKIAVAPQVAGPEALPVSDIVEPTPASPGKPVEASTARAPAQPTQASPSPAARSPSVQTPPLNPAPATPSVPNEVKTLLVLFSKAAQTLFPPAPTAAASPVQATAAASPAVAQSAPAATQSGAIPVQPSASAAQPSAPQTPSLPNAPVEPQRAAPPMPDLAGVIAALSNVGLLPQATISSATGGMPNDLKTLLLLFNMAAESWLPRGASVPAQAHMPSVPPPIAGTSSKAQPTTPATLPANADATATATQLLKGTDAAIARQTLLQIASLPDAAPQSRSADARWMFDVPLMTPQGAAVAQMIIERDGRSTSADRPMPVWRVQFAIDVEPLGPVRANLALSGDRTWVTITADRPESLDKLQSNASWLVDALQSTELSADIAFQPGNAGGANNGVRRFVDHAS